MGKHGGGRRTFRIVPALLAVVAVLAVVGCGWWWWSLRSSDDPISADPVSAYGSIVSSDTCTTPGATSTVRFNTETGYVTAPLHVCGYRAEQSILVEYLRSDAGQVRPAGSTPAAPNTLRKILPIGILVFGLIGAGALLVLAREQRSAHRAPGAGPSWTRLRRDAGAEPRAATPAEPGGAAVEADLMHAAEPAADAPDLVVEPPEERTVDTRPAGPWTDPDVQATRRG